MGAWILAAAVFTMGYYLLPLLSWAIDFAEPWLAASSLYNHASLYVSLLAKYIPGNVAAHGVRTQLAMRAGVPVLVLMKSFLLEAIFALGTAAAIAIPGTMYFFPAVIHRFSTWVAVFVAVILVAVVAARRFKLVSLDRFRPTAPSFARLFQCGFTLSAGLVGLRSRSLVPRECPG